ncbi:DAK2 domain-containing protein [Gorillibacterium timonense]|uniref:DAK2 domain-containing protein n=1 Tax=Gorillibacterium timonense TaxID=1689269 RepID=UPI00071D20E3|nr:DAK2 domain-containing protein [Gorillibacterium timonense]
MSKRFTVLNGTDFAQMVIAGAGNLRNNVNNVNALNVFPVPDGDTGTNMNLTMTSGMEEMKRKPAAEIGKAADALSKGLLMGARGNSGVILSQLFRGFAKSVQPYSEVTPAQFAAALQQGVETAYKAVVKPVEGTILTVAKETAKHALYVSRRTTDVVELMTEVCEAARQSLAKTPDLLPVLKQVGVVDAGGQGLLCVYEGFLAALTGQAVADTQEIPAAASQGEVSAAPHPHQGGTAQSMLATEDIEFGYCTEFIIKLVPEKIKLHPFDENTFRSKLSEMGDSLLVVADDDLVKVHVHAEHPGTVMNHAMTFGDLTRIKIENMREQHTHILLSNEYDTRYAAPSSAAADTISREISAEVPVTEDIPEPVTVTAAEEELPPVPFGFVAVAMGHGITEIFESLGVDVVISGGQTMNPSTEDIVHAIEQVAADTVYVFPNNSNIIMAAQQAKELLEGKEVVVIPTKTIPQCMAALVSFQETADTATNTEAMTKAIAQVISGQVTQAVRDTSIDEIAIKEGDFLGIRDGKIVVSEPDLIEASCKLLDSMLANGGEIVTFLTGEDAREEETTRLADYVTASYPDAEVEVHLGGQPLYPYLFAVE